MKVLVENALAGGIYTIWNTKTGKVYVGRTENFHKRVGEHICLLLSDKHWNPSLQEDWNQHLDKSLFEFCVVQEEDCPEKRKTLERAWIGLALSGPRGKCYNRGARENECQHQDPTKPNKKHVEFDIQDPLGNVHHARNIRSFAMERGLDPQKFSSVIRGAKRECDGWHLPGRVLLSPKTFTLVSPVGQLFSFQNMKQFAGEHGIHQSSLSNLLKGKVMSASGWRTLENKDYKPPQSMSRKKTKYLNLVLEKDGVRITGSPRELSERLKLRYFSIMGLVSGGGKSLHGWKIANA